MSTKKVKEKQMICTFRKDGSVCAKYDISIVDEPFMGIVHNTVQEWKDIWFDFIKDSQEAGEKVKPFEVIIKI